MDNREVINDVLVNLFNEILRLEEEAIITDKYKDIIQQKINKNKKHDHIQIIKVNGIEQAFLFQDMFPITEKYIMNPYIKQNTFMQIKDKKKLLFIESNAMKIINLMRHGVKFTPTQPDVIRIEQMLIEELQEQK